ncbi:MAG: hypothetical protein NVS3B26_24360 [Mycobacteriales bacterium]
MKASAALAVLVLAGACGTPSRCTTDAAFLSRMLPHHAAALAAGKLAAERGSDPRVRAFGRRVLAEQTPEVTRMHVIAARERLPLDTAAGSAEAMQEISATELAGLARMQGADFDRTFLTLSIRSEEGAAQMARTELAGGRIRAALQLATSIASAPDGEILELRALLAAL